MKNNLKYTIIIIASAVLAIGGALAFISTSHSEINANSNNNSSQPSSQSSLTTTTGNVTTTTTTPSYSITTVSAQNQNLRKFNSTDELKAFLLDSMSKSAVQYGYAQGENYARFPAMMEQGVTAPFAAPPQSSSQQQPVTPQGAQPSTTKAGVEYSTTNIQVANVDEPDFLKNDGKYAYIISQDKLTIIDAYPGDTAKIISKVGLDVKSQNLQSMFLNKDRLVIFYDDYVDHYYIPQYDYYPQTISAPTTHAVIIDISVKSNPSIIKNYEVTGSFYNARMIGDYVYLVSNSYVDYIHPLPPVLRESSNTIMVPNIYYFPNPEANYNFDTITSFNMFSDQINSTTFLTGSTDALYVTNSSMYIAYQKSYNYYYPYYGGDAYNKDRFFKAVVPLLPDDLQVNITSIDNSSLDPAAKWAKISDLLQNFYNTMSENDKSQLFDKIQKSLGQYDAKIQEDLRKTVIQKFSIADGTIQYVAQGEVPGYLLNQYSMDELGNRFRVATTSEYYDPINGSQMTNNVYVLDGSLNIVGSLEKFAQNESIYAARFMGDKLYLVTYQRVDPFFVIDLSTDTPKILGALKIPGYSSYLHPYDETHIIGIGKETQQNQYGGVEPLGVKVSLYDVSNVTNPITIDSYSIGGPGTDSDVLSDPKAILFDKSKDVLVIPIKQQNYYPQPLPLETPGGAGLGVGAVGGAQSGNATVNNGSPMIPIRPEIVPPMPPINNNWSGFYVFGIDPAKGFTLKGIVEHYNGTDYQYYYYPEGGRSFYIDDLLYTVTPSLMKINDLNDISHEINQIKLENTGQIINYLNK